MVDLPFKYIPSVYHIGILSGGNVNFVPRDYKINWHYEFGLFSVSLHPEAWRSMVGGPTADIFKISIPGRDLRFLDADSTLISNRSDIEAKGLKMGLITYNGGTISSTQLLYDCLNLYYPSFTGLTYRSQEDQILQAALAVISSGDSSVDGLWWTDTLSGTMRTERGGIFQHRLPQTFQRKLPLLNKPTAKSVVEISSIL